MTISSFDQLPTILNEGNDNAFFRKISPRLPLFNHNLSGALSAASSEIALLRFKPDLQGSLSNMLAGVYFVTGLVVPDDSEKSHGLLATSCMDNSYINTPATATTISILCRVNELASYTPICKTHGLISKLKI